MFRSVIFSFGIAATALVLAACGGEGKAGRDGESPSAAQSDAGARDSGGASAVVQSTGDSGQTILFMGTSLTAGYGLDPDSAYPAMIQRKIDSAGLGSQYRVRNAGLSGETSAGALRRIDWLLTEPASIVVVETGANDGLRGLDPDSTRANIQRIITKIREQRPAAQIILAGMEAPRNLGADYTGRFRALYGDLAKENNVALIPFLLEGVAMEPGLNQGDGIHPNAAGARLVAATVWKELQKALRTRR